MPEFNIQLMESDEEVSESEVELQKNLGRFRPPTVDEIDSILDVFRHEAEVPIVYRVILKNLLVFVDTGKSKEQREVESVF